MSARAAGPEHQEGDDDGHRRTPRRTVEAAGEPDRGALGVEQLGAGQQVRDDGVEHGGHADADQGPHVGTAVANRLHTAFEERPAGPEHHGHGEHQLDPGPRLDRQPRQVLAEHHLDVDQKPSSKRDTRWIPVINKVAAGYPADFDDLGYPAGFADDYILCPDIHDPNAFAVRVFGDSMEPKFSAGDIVVFSPSVEAQSGDDCFVRFKSPHETTFKRVFFEKDGRVRLQPRNEQYPPSVVSGKRINGIYRAAIHFRTL